MADARGAQATECFEKEKATRLASSVKMSSVFPRVFRRDVNSPRQQVNTSGCPEEYPRKHSRLFQVNVNSKVNIKCTSV